MIELTYRKQTRNKPSLNPIGQTEETGSVEILFQRYLEGQPEATEAFATLFYPIVLAYFRSRCRNTAEAEDLAQECWTRIHLGRLRFHQGMPVLPWIFGVARHTRLDAYRRNKLRSHRECEILEYRDYADHSQANLDSLLQAKQLLTYLMALPASQRTVLLMQYKSGFSQAEVAQQLGCSTAAVKQKAFRARTTLRHLLHPSTLPLQTKQT